MIKLPKKVARTIEREFPFDSTVIKYVCIKSMYKELCVHLVAFRTSQFKSITILRYFGDDSYSFLGGYANEQEVVEEMSFQVKKLC